MSHETGLTQTPGLAQSLLREIAQALAALAQTGVASTIDLLSLPMSPDDRDALAARLGQGEVDFTLEIAGATRVRETAYAGVWWIAHMGAGGRVAAERLEITPVPEIMVTHRDEIVAASRRLRDELADATSGQTEKDAIHVG